MITDYRFVEEFRCLLDDHIPDQLFYFQKALAANKFNIHNHHAAVRQCQVWAVRITNLLADATKLAAFQARYPGWSTVNLQAIITSLNLVEAAAAAYVADPTPSNLAEIQTVLSQNLAQI